jgi:hypothetical protein
MLPWTPGRTNQGDAEQLTLWVTDGNDRAHAFYLKTGFRPTGIRQVFRRHGIR